jgi:hypothetical protein
MTMATLTGRTSKVGKAARGRTAVAETPLVIRGDVRLDGPAQKRARAKLGRALASMAPQIERLTVRFEDVNGPRGGADTRCRIKAVVAGAPSVVIDQAGQNPEESLARATPRLRRALRDLFDRQGGRMPAPTRPESKAARRPRVQPAPAGEVRSTARRNWRRPNRRMTVKLEDSQTKPSRKNTRRSANRARAANAKTRRARRRATSPRARHRRGK